MSGRWREAMKESWKNNKCGDCALFNTDACYLLTYVDEDYKACDEYIGYGKKEEDRNEN